MTAIDIAPVFFALTPWVTGLYAYNVRLPETARRVDMFFYVFYLSCAALCLAAVVTHVKYPNGIKLPGITKPLTVMQLGMICCVSCLVWLLLFFAIVHSEHFAAWVNTHERVLNSVFGIFLVFAYASMMSSIILPMMFGS